MNFYRLALILSIKKKMTGRVGHEPPSPFFPVCIETKKNHQRVTIDMIYNSGEAHPIPVLSTPPAKSRMLHFPG
jgi:hypothetical protein